MRRGLGTFVIVAAMALPLALTIGSTRQTTFCDSYSSARPHDLALILGSGEHAAVRTDAAVALWQAGLAKQIHFTGASQDPARPTAADMRRRAIKKGVPEHVISVELLSQSTLQNIIFSQDQLNSASDVILVTSGFHVWRSVMTMWSVGYWPDATCQARPKQDATAYRRFVSWGLEIPKWWLNAGRAALWSAAQATGTAHWFPDWIFA